jgi:hypothetical protein
MARANRDVKIERVGVDRNREHTTATRPLQAPPISAGLIHPSPGDTRVLGPQGYISPSNGQTQPQFSSCHLVAAVIPTSLIYSTNGRSPASAQKPKLYHQTQTHHEPPPPEARSTPTRPAPEPSQMAEPAAPQHQPLPPPYVSVQPRSRRPHGGYIRAPPPNEECPVYGPEDLSPYPLWAVLIVRGSLTAFGIAVLGYVAYVHARAASLGLRSDSAAAIAGVSGTLPFPPFLFGHHAWLITHWKQTGCPRCPLRRDPHDVRGRRRV